MQGFLWSSPAEPYRQCVFLPSLMCDNMHGVSPAREAHLKLGVQRFYWSLVPQAWLTICMADLSLHVLVSMSQRLSLSVSHLSLSCSKDGGDIVQMGQRLRHKSYCWHRLPGMAQGPEVNRDPYQAAHSKGLKVAPAGAGDLGPKLSSDKVNLSLHHSVFVE